MKRHVRDNYHVVGEGVLTFDKAGAPVCERPSTEAELRKFRFSRLGPQGEQTDEAVRLALATAMTADVDQQDSADPAIPAGFTYLGQFIDHDLTMDRTAVALGTDVTVEELLQGRSPALDLDSLYGRGPRDQRDQIFYQADGVRLRTGTTVGVPAPGVGADVDLAGFDLPRSGHGSTKAERRAPLIPDQRNDENLAVAQTHLAFIRFHNRVVDHLAGQGLPDAVLFNRARELVVRHYQWVVRTDFLPRIVDPEIVDDVFDGHRRFLDVPATNKHEANQRGRAKPGDRAAMPVEFSVAAYRLGHSMVRSVYQWNRIFDSDGPGPAASLLLLFTFTGVNGNFAPGEDLDDPDSGMLEALPTNWIADFRRLYDFSEVDRDDLVVPEEQRNLAKRLDTLLVDPLADLPLGSFGGRGTNPPQVERNLAFRNLTRANMVRLASGQQMAEFLGVEPLTAEQIITGDGGANLDSLPAEQKDSLAANTPLWFYTLREAELNNGRLTGVGGRIVAEVFHRAMSGSRHSIVRDRAWRPSLGPDPETFRMTDLLLFAFEGKADLLNPLGDTPQT